MLEAGNEAQNEVNDLFQYQGAPNTAVIRVSGYLQSTRTVIRDVGERMRSERVNEGATLDLPLSTVNSLF